MKITLDRYRAEESGDVFTVEGTWRLEDGAILFFTPCGMDEPILSDAFVASFCEQIRTWLRAEDRR